MFVFILPIVTRMAGLQGRGWQFCKTSRVTTLTHHHCPRTRILRIRAVGREAREGIEGVEGTEVEGIEVTILLGFRCSRDAWRHRVTQGQALSWVVTVTDHYIKLGCPVFSRCHSSPGARGKNTCTKGSTAICCSACLLPFAVCNSHLQSSLLGLH